MSLTRISVCKSLVLKNNLYHSQADSSTVVVETALEGGGEALEAEEDRDLSLDRVGVLRIN